MAILFREFLGQAWMKTDKSSKAPNILLMTKRFNDVSTLVASEIIRRPNLGARVAAIEKWAAVADISRCLHNFNGVLQICSAFTNSAVYRLKKTWEKVSKTVRLYIELLNLLILFVHVFRQNKLSKSCKILLHQMVDSVHYVMHFTDAILHVYHILDCI